MFGSLRQRTTPCGVVRIAGQMLFVCFLVSLARSEIGFDCSRADGDSDSDKDEGQVRNGFSDFHDLYFLKFA